MKSKYETMTSADDFSKQICYNASATNAWWLRLLHPSQRWHLSHSSKQPDGIYLILNSLWPLNGETVPFTYSTYYYSILSCGQDSMPSALHPCQHIHTLQNCASPLNASLIMFSTVTAPRFCTSTEKAFDSEGNVMQVTVQQHACNIMTALKGGDSWA